MDTITHNKYKVKQILNLTKSTYVVRMDRKGMNFIPGQNLNLGLAGDTEKRDYSIYSRSQDDFLEILVKEVEDGMVSKKLKRTLSCIPGNICYLRGMDEYRQSGQIHRSFTKGFV